MTPPQSPPERPVREPLLNAPAVAVLLAASMPLLFLAQLWVGDPWILHLAFRPASLFDGRWWPGLVGAMLVHASWVHVGMNAIAALAFAPPVARLMSGARGVVAFLLFYTACGVFASLGYGLVHADEQVPLVGASGAIFGLMGAAIRVLGRSDGRLRPLTDRTVLVNSAALMAVNAGLGLVGLMPGADGARVAWEAHAFGYIFGLVAIGPLLSLLNGRAAAFASADDLRDPPT